MYLALHGTALHQAQCTGSVLVPALRQPSHTVVVLSLCWYMYTSIGVSSWSLYWILLGVHSPPSQYPNHFPPPLLPDLQSGCPHSCQERDWVTRECICSAVGLAWLEPTFRSSSCHAIPYQTHLPWRMGCISTGSLVPCDEYTSGHTDSGSSVLWPRPLIAPPIHFFLMCLNCPAVK